MHIVMKAQSFVTQAAAAGRKVLTAQPVLMVFGRFANKY